MDQPSPKPGFLLRHYVELITLIVLLFVIQTGLVPYDFINNFRAGVSSELFQVHTYDLRFPDIVSNIFLYIPLAAMVNWCLIRRIRIGIISAILSIVFVAILSGAIEYIQAYSPSRISSLIDWVSNIAGAILGVLLSWVARWFIPRLIDAAMRECKLRPQMFLVFIYSISLIIIATNPFSFSFDVSRLKQCVKSVNLVPFYIHQTEAFISDPLIDQNSSRAKSLAQWHNMKSYSRWAAECASFMVLVWLLQAGLCGYYGFRRMHTFLLTLWMTGGLAIILSILQISVISRTSDITDVIFRMVGIVLGIISYRIVVRKTLQIKSDQYIHLWRKPAWIGSLASFIFILYSGLIPLDYSKQIAPWDELSSSYGFLPFFAYFLARFDLMMADASGKFLMYFIFAVFFAAGSTRLKDKTLKVRILVITLCGLTMSIIIEIIQLVMPVRVTSLTDPIIASVGSMAGVVGFDFAKVFYHFAVAQEGKISLRPQIDQATARGLSPTDAMIADLADPYQDAPVESDPSTSPQRQHASNP